VVVVVVMMILMMMMMRSGMEGAFEGRSEKSLRPRLSIPLCQSKDCWSHVDFDWIGRLTPQSEPGRGLRGLQTNTLVTRGLLCFLARVDLGWCCLVEGGEREECRRLQGCRVPMAIKREKKRVSQNAARKKVFKLICTAWDEESRNE
jgi:hypothetical protein